MIDDITVLREEYVPRGELFLHRHRELEQLATALQPVEHGDPGETVLLYGPSGTGKTTTAKVMLDQLTDEVSGVTTAYVDAWHQNGRGSILYSLVQDLCRVPDVHRQSTPVDELYTRLEDLDRQAVVIVDEVDQVDDAILRDLYGVSALTPILIANRERDLLAGRRARTQSRLSVGIRIQFAPYSVSELVDIIDQRAAHGLSAGVVSDDQLERIADVAAGDARRAIKTLRLAARKAENRGTTQITASVLEAAIEDGETDTADTPLSELDPHQRLLYEILEEDGPIGPSTLYERYQERVASDLEDEPRADRTVRKYLNTMQEYNLIKANGSGQHRVYRTASG